MSILDTIDGALRDYEASDDAMRWVPEEDRAKPPSIPAGEATAAIEAFDRMLANIAEGINRAYAAMRAAAQEQARACAEFVRAMMPVVEVLNEVRAARVSAMHREYGRRSKARQRRRR